jgi:hypothetical protein
MFKLIVRNASAIIGGFVSGSLLNYLLIEIGSIIFPAPPGIDLSTVEGMKAGFPQLGWEFFLFPWLAHAAGTLLGAYVCTRISWDKTWWLAMTVGLIYLSGGIIMAKLVPDPTWYLVADLGLAYIPMAFIGWKLALWKKK